VTEFLSRYTFLLPGLKDLVQILIVAVGLYYVLRLLARTRAIQMLLGLLLLVAFYFIARLLDLDLIRYVMERLFQYGAIAALIVFQPELRNGLARLGQSRMLRLFSRMPESQVVEEVVEAVDRLARAQIGAIIAIGREVGLQEYTETGTKLHARVSADLLAAIFAPYGPLHDGAVLIEGDTIIAAGVILPLTQFPVADRSLGTRHRAALGLSEETDALVIVVSEETAQITLAQRGRLERGVSLERVRSALAGLPLAAAAARAAAEAGGSGEGAKVRVDSLSGRQ
jgi:diadenylate cyclase